MIASQQHTAVLHTSMDEKNLVFRDHSVIVYLIASTTDHVAEVLSNLIYINAVW